MPFGKDTYEKRCVFCPWVCVECLEYGVFIFERADTFGAREGGGGVWLRHWGEVVKMDEIG